MIARVRLQLRDRLALADVLDAGFDDHVVKPIELHTIERMVRSVRPRSGATAG